MADELQGKRIAILAATGVEQVELEKPREAVEAAGAETELLSIESGEIQAMNHDIDKADKIPVDRLVSDASPDEFDGLLLPGGTVNADNLRQDEDVISFVQSIFRAGKPVAAKTRKRLRRDRERIMAAETIGFVGTGRMGGPMAGRLLDSGYSLCVYDSQSEATKALVARGAPKAVAARA